MEVRATAKYVRVQPRKVRIIADEIRGTRATHSAALLRYHPSKSAKALHKVLLSAMANAQENHGLSPEDLKIATIMVDEGPRLKRMRARAMGRGYRIMKKTSHITVVVEDQEATPAVKPHGTKAKPRPSFAAPARGKKRGGPVKGTEPVAEPVAEEPVAAATEPEPVVEALAAEPIAAEAAEPAEHTSSAEPEPAGTESETAAPEEPAPEKEAE
jgi:large subunit ribosomal protein L22